jgi:MOSC domain-containing protein YiiM
MLNGRVVAVARDGKHRFSKQRVASIAILAGLGVEGDAHKGDTVKHRSRVAVDPSQPNLRQVHLIHAELFAELAAKGFEVRPADLGENITTEGVDLLSLPTKSVLSIGNEVVLEVTGLRNPCTQIERFQPGLLAAVIDRNSRGELIRKAGIMTVALNGGVVRPGDPISVALPHRLTFRSSASSQHGNLVASGLPGDNDDPVADVRSALTTSEFQTFVHTTVEGRDVRKPSALADRCWLITGVHSLTASCTCQSTGSETFRSVCS